MESEHPKPGRFRLGQGPGEVLGQKSELAVSPAGGQAGVGTDGEVGVDADEDLGPGEVPGHPKKVGEAVDAEPRRTERGQGFERPVGLHRPVQEDFLARKAGPPGAEHLPHRHRLGAEAVPLEKAQNAEAGVGLYGVEEANPTKGAQKALRRLGDGSGVVGVKGRFPGGGKAFEGLEEGGPEHGFTIPQVALGLGAGAGLR